MDACWFCQATVAMQWYTQIHAFLFPLKPIQSWRLCTQQPADSIKVQRFCQTAAHWLSMLTALSLCHHFHWKWSKLAILLAPELLAACAGSLVTLEFFFYFPSCKYVWTFVHVHVCAFLSTHFNGIQNTELPDQATPSSVQNWDVVVSLQVPSFLFFPQLSSAKRKLWWRQMWKNKTQQGVFGYDC